MANLAPGYHSYPFRMERSVISSKVVYYTIINRSIKSRCQSGFGIIGLMVRQGDMLWSGRNQGMTLVAHKLLHYSMLSSQENISKIVYIGMDKEFVKPGCSCYNGRNTRMGVAIA